MKKISIVIALLVSAFGIAQVDVIGPADGLLLDTKTSTVLNGIGNPREGLLVGNKTTHSLWYYNGTEFVDLMAAAGGGVTDHGALTGLSDDDHTQYHTDARAATWLSTLYANLDGDDSDDVTITGTQTITGIKYFNSQIRIGNYLSSNDHAVRIANDGVRISSLNRQNSWYIYNNLGYAGDLKDEGRISIYPTDEFIEDHAFYYDYEDSRWEIGESPILTQGNSSGYGIGSGGTDDQTAAEVTIADIAENFTSTDVEGALAELATNISPYKFQYENGIGNFQPRLEPSTGNRGQIYYDINSEKLRTYNGTSNDWEDVGNGGGSTSLTRYHSINEITTDITADYSNQVTGSGYGVVNTVSGNGDYVVTIENLRSGLVNENYSFKSIGANATLTFVGTIGSVFDGKGKTAESIRITDYGSVNFLESADGIFQVDGDFTWVNYSQNLILNGLQGAGSGNGATGGTHPGMTRSGTIPIYIISDDGSSAFDFNRYEVKIVLADNGLSVGDTIKIEADDITGGTNPNIYVNINSNSNTEIATIDSSNLSDTGVIPSGATELSIWFIPNFNSTNNTTATFTNVSVTKL